VFHLRQIQALKAKISTLEIQHEKEKYVAHCFFSCNSIDEGVALNLPIQVVSSFYMVVVIGISSLDNSGCQKKKVLRN
jgi:hypothetical protein